MKPLCWLALAVAALACPTGQTPGDDAPPTPAAEFRDPERAFRKACAQLVVLERKHDLLKGVAEAKPVLERDEKERLKSASLVFQRNALPPAKGPAQPKDESKPFFMSRFRSGQVERSSPRRTCTNLNGRARRTRCGCGFLAAALNSSVPSARRRTCNNSSRRSSPSFCKLHTP